MMQSYSSRELLSDSKMDMVYSREMDTLELLMVVESRFQHPLHVH